MPAPSQPPRSASTSRACPPFFTFRWCSRRSIAAGALWGMLAGWLKVRFGASEIVTTIMLNYIAIIGTGWLVTGPMIEGAGKYPQTAKIAEAAMLPRFLPPTRLAHRLPDRHTGLRGACTCCSSRRAPATHIRAVGINPEAARYAGIDVRKNVLFAMAISGGTAGLAGGVEIAGVAFRLYQQISPGFGFDAIAVSLLANNNPIGVIFSGILFGALRSGSDMMQITAKIPSVLVFSIQGLVILAVVAFGVYRQRSVQES